MRATDKYRMVAVEITDAHANDIRLVAAHVSKSPVAAELDGPVHSLVALVALISDAQHERELTEAKVNEREEYR